MNYTEYAISEIMIKLLKNGKLSTELAHGLLEVEKPYVSARLTAIQRSLQLIENCDVVTTEQCKKAISSFKRLLNKSFLSESDLTILLNCVEDIERAENKCKKVVADDWNLHLSKPLNNEEVLENYKLLIRSIDRRNYKNERDYPTISTSLLTPMKSSVYRQGQRGVALVYDMSAEHLIAMSARDSNTCDAEARVMELPLHSGIFSLTSTFSANDYLKLFDYYHEECLCTIKENPKETGEILFASSINPKAVLLCENASKKDEVWGKGYAAVYDLPVYRLQRTGENNSLVLVCEGSAY